MEVRIILPVFLLFNMAAPLALEAGLPFFGKKRTQSEAIAIQNEKADAAMKLALSALEQGKERAALSKFKTVYKKYPSSIHAPDALYRSAKIYFEKRKWKKSFENYYRIIRSYPEFEQYGDVLTEQFEIASALMAKKTSRYFGVIPYRNYDQAARYFEVIVGSAPYSEYAPLALMNTTLIYAKLGKTLERIITLNRLIETYPKSMLAPDAYLDLAESFAKLMDGPQYDQGSTREAMKYFEDFLILFPDSPELAVGEEGLRRMQETYAKSKLVMGEFYYKKRRNYVAAEVFFSQAIDVAPNSVSAKKAQDYRSVIETIPEEERTGRIAGKAPRTKRKGRFGLIARKGRKEAEIATEANQTLDPSAEEAPDAVEVAEISGSEDDELKKDRKSINKTLTFWRRGRNREKATPQK